MDCPKCNHPGYQFSRPCPRCQPGDVTELAEELAHVEWLLAEMAGWQLLYSKDRARLRRNYTGRRKRLEIALGLRLPPFSQEEAREAWPKLVQREALLQKMAEWSAAGLVNQALSQTLVDQTKQQVCDLREQLDGHHRPGDPATDVERLTLTNFLLEAVEDLSQTGGFTNPGTQEQVAGPLLSEQEQLEIELGLRPEPVPEPVEATGEDDPARQVPESPQPAAGQNNEITAIERVAPQPEILAEPDPAPIPGPPPKPRLPFRERLWQMLLSERTLQAMLFLGIFLLFSAALSFVAWGWKDFSAAVRVTIPIGFTGLFFALGWYVRTQTPMYRSGIALSAIAALLIPIDFYTIYVNFNIRPEHWPVFWFMTSVTCLLAYTATTFIIRSQFFGYLVGTAAGSTVLALIEMGHQAFGLSLDWRSAGLSGLALGLIVLATTLAPPFKREATSPVRAVLAGPFRFLALLTISTIMLLTFGWRFIQRDSYDPLHYALTINWWLGGFIFGWGALQYRSRGMGLLAAVTLPVATYLTQAAIFDQVEVNPAWHAFGWALLIPLYFVVGYKLLAHTGDPVAHSHGRTAVGWGVVLLIVAAFWSLTDLDSGAAAAGSHGVLAGAVILAALLWRQPIYLYGASLLSFSAMSFAMAELGLTLAQLSVGWASLAIAHIVVGFNLGTRFPIPVPNFAGPLVIAGYLIAAVAVLPVIFPYDGDLLIYALGNWLALAGWGARLAHVRQPGFTGRGIWRKPMFHWFTAGAVPIWLWILFTNTRPLDATFPLALAALAWGMVLLSYRLAKVNPAYRAAWLFTGGLVSWIAPLVAFVMAPDGFAPGLTLLAVGFLYFTDALTNRQSVELVPAGLVTAWGYMVVLNRLQLSSGGTGFGLASLIAVYVLAGLWTSRKKSGTFTPEFLTPHYITTHFLAFILLVRLYLPAVSLIGFSLAWSDQDRLWGAASQFLVAGIYAFYAWRTYQERWAHVATWLIAAGSAFIFITYSTTTGSVVAELAFIPLAFVLAERGLHQLCRRARTRKRQQTFLRLTWNLYRRPLLLTAWASSATVIGLALLTNFLWPGGGREAQIWAIIALTLVTALYAVSAGLFRQIRFVWLAASLSIAPWTILANLSWFTSYQVQAATYTLSWAVLAWVLFMVSIGLRHRKHYPFARPPLAIARGLMLFTVFWSMVNFTPDSLAQAVGLVASGLLYFADAAINRQRPALAPAVLVSGWGFLLGLDWLNLSFDVIGFVLTVLVAIYILGGLWTERRKSVGVSSEFLSPLYVTTHILALGALGWIYARPVDALLFGHNWTDTMLLWGAAGQLVLGSVYGLYAWIRYKERWAHFAGWLWAFGGGFTAITLSTGSGASAAKVALGASAFILVERGLHQLFQYQRVRNRQQEFIRLTWHLYRRPLLFTGWVISVTAIGLALIRNLLLLDGGQTRQIWAAIALLLIVGLYALAARLFRQARFLWLAAPLSFAPWTILSYLGWLIDFGGAGPLRPTLPGYALSWIVLAWTLLLTSLVLSRRAPWTYGLPVKVVAHMLLPFSLLWGLADVDTSRFTFGLAVGFYGLAAVCNHQRWRASRDRIVDFWQTKFLYPALALIPIWGIYLMAWLLPTAQREHYGLMFLAFGPPGMAGGQWLYRQAPRPGAGQKYALPAYLVSYGALIIGTALVAHMPALLALVLLFEAVLMMVSAWLFKDAVWAYLAAGLIPVSLLLTLRETGLPANRYGWWLIGLASIYLVIAWLLRRANLPACGKAVMTTGLILIALGLPPSSLDRSGALWAYAGAAVLYAVSAFWLRRPLLLTAASGLILVPYAIGLQNSRLGLEYYGLALFPGALVALVGGWALDRHFGSWSDFPWGYPGRWPVAVGNRLLNWWALPAYTVGFGLVVISPLFAQFRAGLVALNFFLMMPVFGWAVYRFRLRGWLVALVLAGHLAATFYLGALGWWQHPGSAAVWLRFLPVTLIMALVTLFIERYRTENPPIYMQGRLNGWSHPLYIILAIDIIIGQAGSLIGGGTLAAAAVTLTHMAIMAVIASVWLVAGLSYLSSGLGIVTLIQWYWSMSGPIEGLPLVSALLALGYGLIGFSLAMARRRLAGTRELKPWLIIWELPLQRISVGFSVGILVLTVLLGSDVIGWSIRALLGLPFRHLVVEVTVRMVVGVFGFLGLLYVAIAHAQRWLRLGYLAVGLLLASWMLHVFYIQQWDTAGQLHWYAIPAGSYVIGIAYMEWQQGHKTMARRLDYLAMVMILGSLFWQTLLFGWGYALLLGAAGLAAFFWGSGRRLRRFLYAGMVGVILATVGQLLNSLSSINQWIVFGSIGMLLVLVAIVVERKLEDIKSWREILESWE